MPALNPLMLLLALASQQTEPPPAPRYDRPRAVHRAAREDSFLNTGPFVYKALELQGGWLGGSGVEFNVRDALLVETIGGVQPLIVTMKYDDRMDFESVKAGVELDANLFRFSLAGMKGRWQGSGTVTVDDGFSKTSSGPYDLHGDYWGFKGGIYWPALRVRSGIFEACLGPEFAVAWYYEGLHGVAGSPYQIHDKQDEFVGSLAPRLSIRLLLGGVDVSVDGQLPYLFGAVQGWATEWSAGIGLRF